MTIAGEAGLPADTGEIAYIGPLVGEETRTALARVVLQNPGGQWKPGLFVTGRVTAGAMGVDVAVPKEALVRIEDTPHVFVQEPDGFRPAPVRVGRSDQDRVEILEGLQAGRRLAASGVFHLKAELDKAAFAHAGHSH